MISIQFALIIMQQTLNIEWLPEDLKRTIKFKHDSQPHSLRLDWRNIAQEETLIKLFLFLLVHDQPKAMHQKKVYCALPLIYDCLKNKLVYEQFTVLEANVKRVIPGLKGFVTEQLKQSLQKGERKMHEEGHAMVEKFNKQFASK